MCFPPSSAHRQRPARLRGVGPGTRGGREPGACSAQRRLERKGLVNRKYELVVQEGVCGSFREGEEQKSL